MNSSNHDLFISYAHIDNEPYEPGQQGWVDKFDQHLYVAVNRRMGTRIKIQRHNASPKQFEVWRDPRLRGNDHVYQGIMSALSQASFLLIVLSPSFINSRWCLRELRRFRKQPCAEDIYVGTKSKILKVVKLTPERQPRLVEQIKGYEFCAYDRVKGRNEEYEQALGEHRDGRYWERLDELAEDIKNLLKGGREAGPAPRERTVYLAETSTDLEDDYARVRDELRARGYTVLPEVPLPPTEKKFDEVVTAMLGRACLSIHLVGEGFGRVLGVAGVSAVRRQYELAAAPASPSGLTRLVWLPDDLEQVEPAQQAFLDELLGGGREAGGGPLVTSRDELTSIALGILKAESASAEEPSGEGEEVYRKKIYLIFEHADTQSIKLIYDYLNDEGYHVLLSKLGGGCEQQPGLSREAVALHEIKLAQCDAVLIYYGSGDQTWMEYKEFELEKIPGLKKTHGGAAGDCPLLRCKGIYIKTTPGCEHKKTYRLPGAVLMRHEEFSSKQLKPFLERLGPAVEVADNAG